jgi:hypothetical protein
VYSIHSDKWKTKTYSVPMSPTIQGYSAFILNSQLHVFGGTLKSATEHPLTRDSFNNTHYTFDLAGDRVTTKKGLNVAMQGMLSALMPGPSVYLFGGTITGLDTGDAYAQNRSVWKVDSDYSLKVRSELPSHFHLTRTGKIRLVGKSQSHIVFQSR